ncbi:MAG: hypothetical protein LBQ08_01515 [Holosporaceae bacterium]|jgi:hypothetical protein|nr:hypothetical protein [Holosporaceae bacterium]
MKNFFYFIFYIFLFSNVNASSVTATGGIMAMTAASSLKTLTEKNDSMLSDFFAPKGGVTLEEVMLSTEEDMNDRGAVKVHMIVVYEQELVEELMKMSAYHYFRSIDQLIKDHPDKIKIFEWELVAKKRITPWQKVEYPSDHMTPLAGYIFAKYSGTGEYRAKIPPSYKKVKITFERKNFRVDYEDKND